jgi:uncharacterized membrane protein AbrB (regulator of aidB expression)
MAGLDEYKAAYRAVSKAQAIRFFWVHLAAYLAVNAFFTATNLLFSPEELWFFYPLVGWGVGLLCHYLFGVRWLDQYLRELELLAERRLREQG